MYIKKRETVVWNTEYWSCIYEWYPASCIDSVEFYETIAKLWEETVLYLLEFLEKCTYTWDKKKIQSVLQNNLQIVIEKLTDSIHKQYKSIYDRKPIKSSSQRRIKTLPPWVINVKMSKTLWIPVQNLLHEISLYERQMYSDAMYYIALEKTEDWSKINDSVRHNYRTDEEMKEIREKIKKDMIKFHQSKKKWQLQRIDSALV